MSSMTRADLTAELSAIAAIFDALNARTQVWHVIVAVNPVDGEPPIVVRRMCVGSFIDAPREPHTSEAPNAEPQQEIP